MQIGASFPGLSLHAKVGPSQRGCCSISSRWLVKVNSLQVLFNSSSPLDQWIFCNTQNTMDTLWLEIQSTSMRVLRGQGLGYTAQSGGLRLTSDPVCYFSSFQKHDPPPWYLSCSLGFQIDDWRFSWKQILTVGCQIVRSGILSPINRINYQFSQELITDLKCRTFITHIIPALSCQPVGDRGTVFARLIWSLFTLSSCTGCRTIAIVCTYSTYFQMMSSPSSGTTPTPTTSSCSGRTGTLCW